MRRDVDVLPTPTSVQLSGLAQASAHWLRSALAIAAGVGFAIFLFGLAYNPFASSQTRR